MAQEGLFNIQMKMKKKDEKMNRKEETQCANQAFIEKP